MIPRAIWLRLILYPVLIYGGLVLLLFLRQYRILYLPQFMTDEQSDREARFQGLRRWPQGDSLPYRGWVSDRDFPDPPRAVVVVFHGNAGWAGDRSFYRDALEARGLRVVLAEYPGYGSRPGKLGEASFVADGMQTVQAAAHEFGRPLYLWGESLGSGVAAAVAAQTAKIVDGVVLVTPWDRLPDVARHYYPYLPAQWILRDRYDNIANLEAFGGPVAILLCEHDQIVPPRFGQRLYNRTANPKRRWVFPGADHNEWPTDASLKWWDDVIDFLENKRESGSDADG